MTRHLAASLLPLLGLASCSLINAYDDVAGAGGGGTTSSSSSQGGGATSSSSASQGGGGGDDASSSSQGGAGGSSSSQGGGGGGDGGAGGGVPALPLSCQFVSSSQRLGGSTQNLTGNLKRFDEVYPWRVGTSVRVVGVRRDVDTAVVDQYVVPDDNTQGTASQTGAFARAAIFHIGRVGSATGIAVREGGGQRLELQRWLDTDPVNVFASSTIADPSSGTIVNARFETLSDFNDIDVFWERSTGANTFDAFYNHYDGTLESTNNLTIGGGATTIAARFPGPVVRAGADVVAFLGVPTMSSTSSSLGYRFQVTTPPGGGTSMQPGATAMVALGKANAGRHAWAALAGFANEIQLRTGTIATANVDDIDTASGKVAHVFPINAPAERFRAEMFGDVLVLAGFVSDEPALLVADAASDAPLRALELDVLKRSPPQGYGRAFGVRPRPGFDADGGLLDIAWTEVNADNDSDTLWVGAIDCRVP